MFVRFLKLDESVRTRYDLSTLQLALHAAAPCPVDVKQAMLDWWGEIIYEYYGATEGNGLTFVDSAGWRTHPGTVGRAFLGVIHICDDEGAELRTGEDGTVLLDFNRAVNLPCAFTDNFPICPVPPPQNRLPFPIEVGEKDPHHPPSPLASP